ncbi:hypothetical protein [Rhodopila sp.]|jgi:hypothetical protein|uniref:hypothetical protein n=1 Tax=Rhodopila sp. TaxID=2480087 RepID=UPI002B6DC3AA|nr:hypothetical protein [Rhodopila sp.]HVZ10217.1 hypothetical protein [Rhodopila sp.]
MHLILTAGLAGLAVLAGLFVVASFLLRIRLQRHASVIADAEQLKPVDLTSVVNAHVSPEQRTNIPEQELSLAKAAVGRKLRDNSRTLILACSALVVLVGANAIWRIVNAPKRPPSFRESATGVIIPPVDALQAITGTWGWKYNSLLSCKTNPHTITLSDDKRHLTIRFKQPLTIGSTGETVERYDYTVVSAAPNELVLDLQDGGSRKDEMGRPLRWVVHFEDKDTYYLKRSDLSTQDTGLIGRCPSL